MKDFKQEAEEIVKQKDFTDSIAEGTQFVALTPASVLGICKELVPVIAQALSNADQRGAERVCKAVSDAAFTKDGSCRSCYKNSAYDDDGKPWCEGADMLNAALSASKTRIKRIGYESN